VSHQVVGIDHVAITVPDIEIACAFYERLFGATPAFQHAPTYKVLMRQIATGTTVLSIHQAGNGLDLVANIDPFYVFAGWYARRIGGARNLT
jgi:catechol 2,3-dioxygenase-like lactoylglutathione lyase family enzyme